MNHDKMDRLRAAGYHITDDPRDLVDPLSVITELRSRVLEMGKAFDAQTEELLIACEIMTPDQLNEFRLRAYPDIYPGK